MRPRQIKAVGSRIIVLPDRHDTIRVAGHEYEVDPASGLVLGHAARRNTGIVLSVGHLVDEPELMRLRGELERARETGEAARTLRVLWIRDLSLVVTVDGIEYASLTVPTAADWREQASHRELRRRHTEEVLAIVPSNTWILTLDHPAESEAAEDDLPMGLPSSETW